MKNGKAFEYAIAFQYYSYLKEIGVRVTLIQNSALEKAKSYYDEFDIEERIRYDKAAYNTISTLIRIEPGLTEEGNNDDILRIYLNEDQAGEEGDVRDIVFQHSSPNWEIGFSAKNNNDAVKHSRLGKDLDFGNVWLGFPCSDSYWNSIRPIFQYLEENIQHNKKWSDLGDQKEKEVYVPLLKAFREEMLRLANDNFDVPKKLIEYLIGNKPFYKIIKDDAHNLVVVKAFNISGALNKPFGGVKSEYSLPRVNFPTRVVEFEFKEDSTTTLNMILDRGWEISFRIHNASTMVERSLKFDIKLLGNPPILFTQYIFQ
ncbi:MAG: HaeIII family restriction endonuclease [Muribaculaceae bacterium]|nr:HaeIII family restriction endonuclease [Muribaculaceae bacterium]